MSNLALEKHLSLVMQAVIAVPEDHNMGLLLDYLADNGVDNDEAEAMSMRSCGDVGAIRAAIAAPGLKKDKAAADKKSKAAKKKDA